MTSFCLQKVNQVYKVDYAFRDKSSQKTCFNESACFAKHYIDTRDNSY